MQALGEAKVEILKGKNDTGALPQLKALAEDPNQDEGTKKAAAAAISVLEKKLAGE